MIEIFTDGACAQNQYGSDRWPGGWGVYMIRDGKEYIKSGNSGRTTNNIMELEAFKEALILIYPFASTEDSIEINVDSAYIVNCFNQKWYKNWQRNGWQTAKKEPVKNKELWETIIRIYEKISELTELKIVKVKSHSGNVGNAKADALATEAKDKAKRGEIL